MAVMQGEITLPSHEAMDTMFSELHRRRRLGYKDEHFHRFGLGRALNYVNDLSALADIPSHKPFKQTIVRIVLIRLLFSYTEFKKYQYRVGSDEKVTEILDGQVVNTWRDLVWLVSKQMSRLLYQDFFGVLNVIAVMLTSKMKSSFV